MNNKEKLLLQFASHLSKVRAQKQLSIRQLAAASGLEYSQLQRIEKGKVNLSFTTLITIAQGLEIHPKELLDFEFD
ncbi:helix-turn-helix domain-containing protein [Ilyomonas limi]|uniref:helix-turn-helix domain-containing protein n=1 Tax=Ilyomonas limi TaxID=2575867 RepID=UPI001485707E|nr:helix-turn-helix transcriptional regulator [Ilyomonas limi]